MKRNFPLIYGILFYFLFFLGGFAQHQSPCLFCPHHTANCNCWWVTSYKKPIKMCVQNFIRNSKRRSRPTEILSMLWDSLRSGDDLDNTSWWDDQRHRHFIDSSINVFYIRRQWVLHAEFYYVRVEMTDILTYSFHHHFVCENSTHDIQKHT